MLHIAEKSPSALPSKTRSSCLLCLGADTLSISSLKRTGSRLELKKTNFFMGRSVKGFSLFRERPFSR